MLTMLIDNEQELVIKFFSKSEIEQAVHCFIETQLETTDSGTLYLLFKQTEYAVKLGLDVLKDLAFDALGQQLEGGASGKINGHAVTISYPREWCYSPAVDDLKEQHKKQLVELREREKAEGVAKQIQGKARIVVTLRER